MGRVALRGIRAHLVRFVLSVLAVTLGVAFVAGTFSLKTMMSSTFSGIVNSSTLGDAYVRGAEPLAGRSTTGTTGATRNTIPASLATSIAGVDGVDKAFAEISGPIVLVGADGTAVISTQAPSFGMALHPGDTTVNVIKGRAPGGPGEIALESATLASAGLSVGDRTRVVLAGSVHDVQVVGEISMGTPMAGATIVFLDVATATTTYAPQGLVSTITVYATPGVSEPDLVARLTPVLAHDGAATQALTGDAMRTEATADIEGMLGFVQMFMLIFAGISLFVGAFIISNTFSMSVRQRMREFALLRAVGASPTQVFASILIQAAVVGLAGSALGIAGGLGLVSLLRVGFERMGMDLSGSIPLDGFTVLISLLLGTVVAVAAAAVPARRAALTAPVEAMRDDGVGGEKSLRIRTVAGLLVVSAGLAGLVAAQVRPTDNGAAMLCLGATGLVAGVLLLAPVIARHTLGLLAAVFVAGITPLGRLARGNVTRNPRRTANTAGALMIGMALVAAASVLAASATASTRAIVADGWTSDFSVQSATGNVPAGAIADVRALTSVAAVDAFTFGPALVAGPTSAAPQSLTVVGLPPAAFGRSLDLKVTSGSLDTLASGRIAILKSAAADHGWSVGDRVTFTSKTGDHSAAIGAIVERQVIGSPIIMSDTLFAQIVPAAQTTVQTLLVTAAPGTSPSALRTDLVDAAKPYVVLSVLDAEDFATQLAAEVNQILVILYALLGLSIVIAVLGIVNTLALSVIERTREIGLMRAVGLGRLQLAGIVTIESVLTAVFGTVVGLVVGVAIAAVVPTVFTDVGLTSLAIPWPQLAGMLALAAAVGVLAALWPALRAARLPVLDAVGSD